MLFPHKLGKMTAIQLEDIVCLGIVSVLSGIQITIFGLRVGQARRKHKINYPAMTGNVDFERYIRAHQNTLEFMPIFLPLFWTAGIFFHQVPVAIAGLVYLYARQMYFDGYTKSVEERIPGFRLCGRMLIVLLLMVSIGVVDTLLKAYLEIDIRKQYLPF